MSPTLPPVDIFRRAARVARAMQDDPFENGLLKDGCSFRFPPGLRKRPSETTATIIGQSPLTVNKESKNETY